MGIYITVETFLYSLTLIKQKPTCERAVACKLDSLNRGIFFDYLVFFLLLFVHEHLVFVVYHFLQELSAVNITTVIAVK